LRCWRCCGYGCCDGCYVDWFRRRLGFPSLNRHSGDWFCEPTDINVEHGHRAFTNVVPFDESKPKEVRTTIRYGRVYLYRWSLLALYAFKFWPPFFHTNSDWGFHRLVGLIWERATTPWPKILNIRCWKNIAFPTPHMAKSSACNSPILYPLGTFCLSLSMIVDNTYKHVNKDKEKVIKSY
jgi:hypothetical protein